MISCFTARGDIRLQRSIMSFRINLLWVNDIAFTSCSFAPCSDDHTEVLAGDPVGAQLFAGANALHIPSRRPQAASFDCHRCWRRSSLIVHSRITELDEIDEPTTEPEDRHRECGVDYVYSVLQYVTYDMPKLICMYEGT